MRQDYFGDESVLKHQEVITYPTYVPYSLPLDEDRRQSLLAY